MRSRKPGTTRRMITALVAIAMLFALFTCSGARSSVSAAVSEPLASSSPDGSDTLCEGGTLLTYYDSSRGDSIVLPTPFFPFVFTGGRAILKGWLYLPANSSVADSPRDLPLIVHNHGSDKSAGTQCEMAAYFTGKGFAFFVPHRRGQGKSTGTYFSDFLDLFCGRTDQNPYGTCGRIGNNAALLVYLQDQTFEVAQAISYVSSLKNSAGHRIVNPNKIAIMGHSFGGIVTLFNNRLLTNHQAAIDIAGASESWEFYDGDDETDGDNTPDNSASIRILKDAVRDANRPIFFFEPKNDVSIRPTVVLSKVAGDQNERFQAAIYGPVPPDPGEKTIDTTHAHGKFVTDHDEVRKWGPAVVEFLARFGVK
ncbi:MAG TPA: acetylxylan esterase [Blastocatellia bacterium]|nr:acetylxylan esterase [Blastocatellia bacterium]